MEQPLPPPSHHVPPPDSHEVRQDVEQLWHALQDSQPQQAEKLISRYPKDSLPSADRNRCLQYEFRRSLGLELPPRPAELWSVQAWSPGTTGTGLISELSQSLADGDSLSIHLRREGEQLVVRLIPHPYPGETVHTTNSVDLSGTPLLLDHELAQHLPMFSQTRRTVREHLQRYAAVTAHHLDTDEQAEGTPDAGQGQIQVLLPGVVNLANCVVEVQGQGHRLTTTAACLPVPLVPGRYNVHVRMEGHAPYSTVVNILAGQLRTVRAILIPEYG